jgi:hypothetical protein
MEAKVIKLTLESVVENIAYYEKNLKEYRCLLKLDQIIGGDTKCDEELISSTKKQIAYWQKEKKKRYDNSKSENCIIKKLYEDR